MTPAIMKLRTVRLHLASLGLPFALAAGCAVEQPSVSARKTAAVAGTTVGTLAGEAGGCTTSVVLGLSTQIAEQAACDTPNSWVSFAGDSGLAITSNAVLPFLTPDARSDLDAAGQQSTLQINSALRTIAQQYLLYQWWEDGECGIAAAATVGNSNHEGGRAVDLDNWDDEIDNMANNGWDHDVPGDVVHFDHNASADDRGRDVLAFQELWNANNPSDTIGTDGDYGPETEARLVESPAIGFAKGPSCLTSGSSSGSGSKSGSGAGSGSGAWHSHPAAQTVSVDGPDTVVSGQVAHYAFTVQNQSETDWDDTTAIDVQSDQASQLYDAQSWTSPTQVGTLPEPVAAGAMVTIEFDIQAPAVTRNTAIAEPLVLVDNGAVVGTLDFGVNITTQAGGSTSTDSEPLPPPAVTAGCAAGGAGGAGGLAAVGLALALVRRRRTR
jgi:MYXO-CTERM domain-containing protein